MVPMFAFNCESQYWGFLVWVGPWEIGAFDSPYARLYTLLGENIGAWARYGNSQIYGVRPR
jgi:hypothetical protein